LDEFISEIIKDEALKCNVYEKGGRVSTINPVFLSKRLPILRQLAHPIYVKMGTIPEIVMGIQSATELSIQRK